MLIALGIRDSTSGGGSSTTITRLAMSLVSLVGSTLVQETIKNSLLSPLKALQALSRAPWKNVWGVDSSAWEPCAGVPPIGNVPVASARGKRVSGVGSFSDIIQGISGAQLMPSFSGRHEYLGWGADTRPLGARTASPLYQRAADQAHPDEESRMLVNNCKGDFGPYWTALEPK